MLGPSSCESCMRSGATTVCPLRNPCVGLCECFQRGSILYCNSIVYISHATTLSRSSPPNSTPSTMSEILAITCPSGKQCSHLIPLLYNRGPFTLRLAAHSSASATKLRAQYPLAEVLSIDLQSPSDCRKLLHGATAINAVLRACTRARKRSALTWSMRRSPSQRETETGLSILCFRACCVRSTGV